MTAWVAVARARAVTEKVAGVDPGIIHPLAIAAGDQALLVSGRAVRAEEFLRLENQKARQRKMAASRSPLRAKPGQAQDRFAAVEAIGPVAAPGRGPGPSGGEAGRQPGRPPGD